MTHHLMCMMVISQAWCTMTISSHRKLSLRAMQLHFWWDIFFLYNDWGGCYDSGHSFNIRYYMTTLGTPWFVLLRCSHGVLQEVLKRNLVWRGTEKKFDVVVLASQLSRHLVLSEVIFISTSHARPQKVYLVIIILTVIGTTRVFCVHYFFLYVCVLEREREREREREIHSLFTRYYCLLIPLTGPVIIIAVYLHWLSMKLFKHA